MTHENHKELCDKNTKSILDWAHQVADTSVKDREDLHKRVDDLKDLIPRFQWWFIGILAAVIISSIIGPKYFGQNGNDAKFRELAGYIAAVTGQVEEQKNLITKGNEISQTNHEKLDKLEKEMRKK